MDSSPAPHGRFDIFEIYRRFCDIRSGCAYGCGEDRYRPADDSKRAKFTREALSELLKFRDSNLNSRTAVFDELYRLMSRLDLMGDFSEFSRFYDFVFFMCRENGQKNITVSKAVTAWRLVLRGRFRLLNEWCDFVERNQRHNISEDTWQQVLAFSRCVHENLEVYDPEGAWPVLIDDFVEHMYRLAGSRDGCDFFCNCGDSESQTCAYDDPLPGLKTLPGMKRKVPEHLEDDNMDTSDAIHSGFDELTPSFNRKRSKLITLGCIDCERNPMSNSVDDCMEVVRNSSPLNKSPCAVEGCLSKGFAGLFSSQSCLQFDQRRGRVSYT